MAAAEGRAVGRPSLRLSSHRHLLQSRRVPLPRNFFSDPLLFAATQYHFFDRPRTPRHKANCWREVLTDHVTAQGMTDLVTSVATLPVPDPPAVTNEDLTVRCWLRRCHGRQRRPG